MNGGLNFLLSTDEQEWRFLFYYFVKIDDGQLHNKSVPSHWCQLQGRRHRRQRWHLLSEENQRSHLSLDAHKHKVRQVSQFLPSMSAMFTLKRKSYSLSWTSILSHCTAVSHSHTAVAPFGSSADSFQSTLLQWDPVWELPQNLTLVWRISW